MRYAAKIIAVTLWLCGGIALAFTNTVSMTVAITNGADGVTITNIPYLDSTPTNALLYIAKPNRSGSGNCNLFASIVRSTMTTVTNGSTTNWTMYADFTGVTDATNYTGTLEIYP